MNNLKEIPSKKKIILIIFLVIIAIIILISIYLENNQYEYINNIEVLKQAEGNLQEENITDINNTNTEKEELDKETEEINKEKEEINKETERKNKIAIHITGEVKKTGIIYLEEGSRIADAINKAGGATKNAGLDKVNLAYILEDGQKIYIPNKNEKTTQSEYIISNSGENVLVEEGKSQKTNSEKKGAKKVNINSADQTELETLPGIGPSLAQRILEYRNENGNFEKIEDIQNVKGIGDSKYSNIKEYICI